MISVRHWFAGGMLALPVAALAAGHAGPRFRDVTDVVALRFTHDSGAAGRFYLPEIMGAGAALLDYDNDGDLDVLLVQGHSLLGREASAAGATPRLFRNELRETSRLRFTDVTAAAGFGVGDYGMGVAAGDYDGDGDVDVYLTNYGPNRLYRNDGRGRFVDVTRKSGGGLDDSRWSSSASFTDYDGDGDLDLFVANYVDFSIADNKVCSDPTGVRDYCGPRQFRAAPDRLFRNDRGIFTDVTETAGIVDAGGAGLGVVGADLDGDGRQDFYVANDGGANHFWRNRGDGRFQDAALLAGVALNADGLPEGSMGIAAGDADNDGDVDLFVTNITGESHAFYESLGSGNFEDRRTVTGLGPLTHPYTGFGTAWLDADNDGLLDLFVANGAVTIIEALRGARFPFRQKNRLLRNAGGRFADVSASAGDVFGVPDVGRGTAVGDVDNDGDVDVLVTNNNGPARLVLNESPRAEAGLSVRLQGRADNTHGLGARVGLMLPGAGVVWRRVHTDGSYLSSSDPRAHFVLPARAAAVTLIVDWPGGMRERWKDMRQNASRTITLRQGTGASVPR